MTAAPRSTAAVEAAGVGPRYGTCAALHDVSLAIEPGQVFALLGPNGAGKTSLVEILAGFARPAAGRARVLGLDPFADRGRLRPRLGIMLQRAGFFADLTVAETVAAWRRFTTDPRPGAEALDLAGLGPMRRTRVRHLSGGEQRRLDLALAILGRPRVLFLDEPTTGIDPDGRRATWAVVREMAHAGAAVLLTTHYLEEAEQLATHVGFLARGRLVAAGAVRELLDLRPASFWFRLPDGVPVGEVPIPAGAGLELARGFVRVRTRDVDAAILAITGWANRRGVALAALDVQRPSLDTVFDELTAVEARR